MTIYNYINEIKKSITENRPYDEYKNLFFQYIEFLENILKETPEDIKVICQLAIALMEAREPAEKSVELMEKALSKVINITDDEIVVLLNNLAFFYAEEICDMEKAKQMLERAIKVESYFPNPYNALGMIYLNDNNIIGALNVLKRHYI